MIAVFPEGQVEESAGPASSVAAECKNSEMTSRQSRLELLGYNRRDNCSEGKRKVKSSTNHSAGDRIGTLDSVQTTASFATSGHRGHSIREAYSTYMLRAVEDTSVEKILQTLRKRHSESNLPSAFGVSEVVDHTQQLHPFASSPWQRLVLVELVALLLHIRTESPDMVNPPLETDQQAESVCWRGVSSFMCLSSGVS